MDIQDTTSGWTEARERTTKSPVPWVPRAIGAILALLGALLACGGIWLVARGGSWYYPIAGVLVVATGYLFARRHPAALYVYAAMLAATTIWSVAEVRFDWWQLVARLDVWVGVALVLLAPWVRNQLVAPPRMATLALVLSTALSVLALGVALAMDYHDRPGVVAERSQPVAADAAGPKISPNDWVAYGGANSGNRFAAA